MVRYHVRGDHCHRSCGNGVREARNEKSDVAADFGCIEHTCCGACLRAVDCKAAGRSAAATALKEIYFEIPILYKDMQMNCVPSAPAPKAPAAVLPPSQVD